MTVRNIKLYRLNASNIQQEVDDSKTAYIEVYHKTETLIKLYQNSLVEDKKARKTVNADNVFAFAEKADNLHRLSKQMRASQRRANIYLSKDSSLTHYTYALRKKTIATRRVKETSVANTLKMYHLYEAKNLLSADEFDKLTAFIANLK